MAKALFGHVGVGPDLRLVAEVRRLRGRVAELEAELARLSTDDDLDEAVVVVDPQVAEVLNASATAVREPALT
jgi:hypothetical protein